MISDSVEQKLLWSCCRLAAGMAGSDEFAPDLLKQIDEAKLLTLCHEHRLTLLCYHYFVLPNRASLSQEGFARFSSAVKAITFNQFQLISALHEMRKAFDAAGVQSVFLKGPVLGAQLYGDKLLRYSKDIDVLVPPVAEQLQLADACLKQLGYQSDLSLRAIKAFAKRRYFFGRKDATYQRESDPFTVELHWKSVERAGYSSFYQWPGCRQRVNFQGTCVPVLTDEVYLLYLCLHASSHDWLRANWLLDIVLFMQQKERLPAEVLALAKSLGFEPFVREAFYLAYHWWGLQQFSPYADYSKATLLLNRITLRQQARNEHRYFRVFIDFYITSRFYPRLIDKLNRSAYFLLALTWHQLKKPFKLIKRAR